MTNSRRVWLVTGASSGFGRSLTEFALSQNDIVVATLRKPEVLQPLSETYPADRLLVLKVDVTNPAEIEDAFARTKEAFGRVDVVFNNAGVSAVGEAETVPVEDARALFEVNFWGAVNVSRAAIKFFRELNEAEGRGGVLLQNSSIAGFAGPPGFSFYAARQVYSMMLRKNTNKPSDSSKHALEAFSKSIAKEILPQWKIKICILQTGSFDTNGLANTTFYPENAIYRDDASPFTVFRRMLTEPGFRFDGDANKFAKTVYSLVAEGGDIPLVLPIGQDALGVAKELALLRQKEMAEAAPWSTNLLRDNLL